MDSLEMDLDYYTDKIFDLYKDVIDHIKDTIESAYPGKLITSWIITEKSYVSMTLTHNPQEYPNRKPIGVSIKFTIESSSAGMTPYYYLVNEDGTLQKLTKETLVSFIDKELSKGAE